MQTMETLKPIINWFEIPVLDMARAVRFYEATLACSLRLETRVQGEAPYAAGVSRIVEAVHGKALEKRLYPIMEFITRGWL